MGIETAILGSAVVGAGTSLYGASKAEDAAESQAATQASAMQAQTDLGQDQLQFAKDQYADWEAVFGPVQDNLAEYYGQLDPQSLAAQNVTNIQTSFQQQQEQLNKQFAQRGMAGSGVEAGAATQLAYQTALAKGQARTDAPAQVAQQQAGFLSLGLGQQSSLQGGVQQAYGGLQSAYGTQASVAGQQQSIALQQQQQAMSGVGQALGAGMQAYSYYNQPANPQAFGVTQPYVGYGGS